MWINWYYQDYFHMLILVSHHDTHYISKTQKRFIRLLAQTKPAIISLTLIRLLLSVHNSHSLGKNKYKIQDSMYNIKKKKINQSIINLILTQFTKDFS